MTVSVPAAAACRLELVPQEVGTAWETAAQRASDRLSRDPRACQSVELAVRPAGGALLSFVSASGRRALRALQSPAELLPALEALLVTLPSEPSALGPRPETAPDASANGDPHATPQDVASAPNPSGGARPTATPAKPLPLAAPERRLDLHAQTSLAAGARLALGGAYVSPAFILRASGQLARWELGAAVEWDPAHAYLPGGLPDQFRLTAFLAGLQMGRRESVGPVAFGYGLLAAVASVAHQVEDTDGVVKVADYSQPRVGLYARTVLPASGTFRFITQLDADLVLGSVKRRATLRNDLPDLPRWGFTLSIGLESSIL